MTLIEAIMSRDECSIQEAEQMVEDIKDEIRVGDIMDAEEILFMYGFEPDYLFDIFPL